DLVDLDQLHLDALVAMGREVLADVVGADRQLAVAAVGEDGELDPRGTAVVEQRLDGGADGAARVEDVVDEHAGHSVEPEVELRVAHDRLRVLRRLAAADVDVVPVEGDVELAEHDLAAGEVGDPPAKALGERNAARVDADESDLVQLGVAFDDLVRDPGERPVDGLSVDQDLFALRMRHAHAGSGRTRAGRVIHTPFRPHGTGLKGFVVWRDLTAWNGRHPSVTPQPALEPGLYGPGGEAAAASMTASQAPPWNGRHPGVVPQPALEPGLYGPGGEAAAASMTASQAPPWNGRHPGVTPPSILRPVEQRALERLADLAVDFSANVQSGQIVAIEAETGMEPIVRAVAQRAYERGARFVDATYFDPYVKKARLQHAPDDTLEFVPEWYGKRMLQLGDVHAARIVFVPRVSPGVLNRVDPRRAGRDQLPDIRERLVIINKRLVNWTHMPNVPTEEVYTTPDPTRAHGVVRATKPLDVAGTIVRGLEERFEGGHAVDIQAETGVDVLRERAAFDSDASRLGELALVDREGRIGALGTTFYNTLLDENAASHIALGNAYELTVGADDRGKINRSAIHVDFMIGGDNVKVTGITREGDEVP